MASYEEMQEMHPTAPTPAVMESEMKACEILAAEGILEACIDEVFVRPDVNRTTFVWQIESTVTDTDAEDEWEKEDSSWRCLPQHWQEILNSRLAKHHSAIQDAKAFYEHRLEEFGAEDVKTKNAQKKMTDLQSGKNSCSIVLIMKGTGKEGGQDLYKRCVQNLKGELKVSVSSKVLAHKVCMETLKLVTLEDPPVERSLRIVSVTGKSKEIQEVRLHLNLLSLQSSNVLGGTDLPSSGKAGGKEVEVGAQGGDKEGETGEEAGMENVAVLEDQFEAAEDCLIAAMQCEDVHEDPSKMEDAPEAAVSRIRNLLLTGIDRITKLYHVLIIKWFQIKHTPARLATGIRYTARSCIEKSLCIYVDV